MIEPLAAAETALLSLLKPLCSPYYSCLLSHLASSPSASQHDLFSLLLHQAWNRARLLRQARGYVPLGTTGRKVGRLASVVKGWRKVSAASEEAAAAPPSPQAQAAALIDPEQEGEAGGLPPPTLESEDELKRELAREIDKLEALELKLKVHHTATTAASPGSADGAALDGSAPAASAHVALLRQRVELHRERQALLKEALHNKVGVTSGVMKLACSARLLLLLLLAAAAAAAACCCCCCLLPTHEDCIRG